MKLKKVEMVLATTLAVLTLTACGSTNHASNNSATNEKTTKVSKNSVKKESKKETETSDSEVKAPNQFTKYEDIDQGKDPENIYNDFVNSVKTDQTYGNDPMKNKSLTIILYRPDCPDCQKVEDELVNRIVEGYVYSPLAIKSMGGSEDYKYQAVAVDITKGVPEWVKGINGIADSSGNYHTPTVAVMTPKKVDGKLYWDTFGLTTGTDVESFRRTINYFHDEAGYKSFMNSAPIANESNLIK